MKRALAVLTALLLASPSFAGRVAVVPPWNQTATAAMQPSYVQRAQVAKVCEMLDVMGVDYDIVPPTAMKTLYATTGTVNFEGGLSRNYVAFIHTAWGRGTTGGPAGWKPDSLWLAAKWSAVPQLFIAPATSGAIVYTQTTTIVSCSTGVASPTAFFPTANTAGNSGTAYLLNGPEVWHEPGGDNALYNNTYVRNGINGNGPDYFVRTIVALNSWPPVNQYTNYTDPDGVTRKTQATADTFQLMARYRTAADGSPTGVPIFLCAAPNASAGSNAAMGLQAMAIAALDSASRAAGAVAAVPYDGRIIGVKSGWQPKKVAVYVSRAFARGRPRAAASAQEAKGWYCYADSCDSSFFKASIDSLASLGIPYTVGVNIDSVNTYPAEKAWWARLGSLVEYSPESWSGISTNVGDSLQVTPNRQPDIFGFRRTRTLMPTGRLPGTACADGDTSLSCILTLARDRLKSLGFPYLSRALLAPNGDYIPLNYGRGNMPPMDSLGTALLSADYDHLIGIATPVQTSDVQFAVSAGGSFAGGQTNAFTLGGYERKVPIYTSASHTSRVGTLTFAMTRGFMDDPQTDDNGTVVDPMVSLNGHLHPHGNEQMQGVWGKVWYGNDIPYYFHTFRTSTSVYMIRAGGLGHAGNPTVSATRPEYFHLKWFVNQCKAINRLAGKTVITFVQVDEL